MAPPRIGIIVNPKSTQNTTGVDSLLDTVSRVEGVIHITIGHDVAGDMAMALKKMARIEPEVLIISGGDGTIQACFTELENEKPFGERVPPLAFLPSGKTNMIAEDLGAKGTPIEVFKRLVELTTAGYLQRHLIKRAFLGVDFGQGQRPLYGMFFGGAAIVNGIQHCRKKIYPMGWPNFISHPFAIVTLLLSAMMGGKKKGSAMYADHAEIHVRGGGLFSGRFVVIIATTMDRLLLGMRPYGREGYGDIGFSSVEHRPGAIWGAIKGLVRGTFGKVFINGVQTRRTQELIIRSNDSVTLDGELYDVADGGTVRLFASPQYLMVDLTKKIEGVSS